MRTGFVVTLAAVLVAGVATPSPAAPPSAQRYVVGFEQFPHGLRPGDAYNGGRVVRTDPVLRFAAVQSSTPALLIAGARTDPNVRYIEEAPVLPLLQFTPDDPSFGTQYGPQQVRAPVAWDTTVGTTTKNICVVDTGVRYTHQDLAGARWLGGYDFVNLDADPIDDHGHGTHVAGIAAGSTNNGAGIAGVAQVGILAAKVLNSSGSGAWDWVASGIRWCADNGGHVINMSLGGGPSTVLLDAVRYAYNKGSLLVAASGNGSCSNCVIYPAAYTEVVAVSCTMSNKKSCTFTSKGKQVELAAPGYQVLSTYNAADDAYTTMSGTSMSTPHVSGVAALVWSYVPALTGQGLRSVLQSTAGDLGTVGKDNVFGYGLVDARAALAKAAGLPPLAETSVSRETFDDGAAQGWTFSGLWHIGELCATAPSPTKYAAYNKESTCNYDTGSRTQGNAVFDVDLRNASLAHVVFNQSWLTESQADRIGGYDGHKLQLSNDGGSSWIDLKVWNSKQASVPSWTPFTMSLGGYAGSSVKIRFLFNSADGLYNAFTGWLLDDVEVTAA